MKKILLLFVISLIVSCSGPLDREYNEDMLEEDGKALKESGLSEEDTQMLAGWMIRAKFKDIDLKGKTYGEILEEAKDYKKEEEILAKKTKKEEEKKRQRLNTALTLAMYDKGYEKYNYEEYLTYSLAFENKAAQDIRAFTGTLSIQNLFEKEIKSISLTIDDPIPAGETYKGTYTTDYNQFKDEDNILKSKDLDDLIIVWTPEKIIFTDGTSLE